MTKPGTPQARSIMDEVSRRVKAEVRRKPPGYVKPVATPKTARSVMVVKSPPPLRDPQGVLGHSPRPRKRGRRR